MNKKQAVRCVVLAKPEPRSRAEGGASDCVPFQQPYLRADHFRLRLKVLASASTVEQDVRAQLKNGGNRQAAELVGKLIAERPRGSVHRSGGVRSLRFPFSRSRQGAGRGRA
jgi:hypothetical protein